LENTQLTAIKVPQALQAKPTAVYAGLADTGFLAMVRQ
jgi:hypothetical protein